MSSVQDEVKDRAKDLREDVRALTHDVRKLALAVGGEAREEFEALAKRARAGSEDAYGVVAGAVRERPGVALGIAAGVGVLVGLLLSARR